MTLIETVILQDDEALKLLREHHLCGLFYLKDSSPDLRIDLKDQYKKQWVHNSVLLSEVKRLDSDSGLRGVPGTLLKGVHLLFEIYQDSGSRFMSDIDLLISETDAPSWEKILLGNGYTGISLPTFHGNSFKQEWVKKVGDVEVNIELHTKLFYHLNAEAWKLTDSPLPHLKKLSPEDSFIHLCGHLAFQHTFLKLFWAFDLLLYFNKFRLTMDWKLLSSRARDRKLFRSVQMCLWVLQSFFGVTMSEELKALFGLERPYFWKRLLTSKFLLRPYGNKLVFIFLKHLTKDHLMDALKYDLGWFWHYKIQKLWR